MKFNWGKIKDPVNFEGFRKEVDYLNFQRFRYTSYILLVILAAVAITDFFVNQFIHIDKLNTYIILDIILLAITISVFTITHHKPPKSAKEIKPFHKLSLKIFFVVIISWSIGVAVIELQTVNNLTTYVFSILVLSILFFHIGNSFLYISIYSIITLAIGLSFTNLNLDILAQQTSVLIAVFFVSLYLSRLLIKSRFQIYKSELELKIANAKLDKKIKKRTTSLLDTNKQLVQEINARKKSEKKLHREKERAEESDKLKSAFLANMSHEIRTPLNGILGFVDLFTSPNITEEKKDRYRHIIHNNGEQLLKIIDDIIDISLIESGQLKVNKIEFSISHIVNEAYDFFNTYKSNINKADVEFTCDKEKENTKILSDPVRIQQVIYNLLRNAFKYTTKGKVHMGCRVNSDWCMIYVEDTGIGIPEGKQNIIFERFRQATEEIGVKFGGTGLGLAVSKGILQELSGQIWHDPSYQKGARFCFALPISKNSEEENEKNIKWVPDNSVQKNNTAIHFIGNKDIFKFLTQKLSFPNHNLLYCEKSEISEINPDSTLILCIDFESDDNKHLLQSIRNNTEQKIIFLTETIHQSLQKNKNILQLQNPINLPQLEKLLSITS